MLLDFIFMSEIEKIVLYLVLVFTVFLSVMAVLFLLLVRKYKRILEARQREALDNLIIGQDRERERLSRDLHDQMGPQINAIRVLLSSVKTTDPQIAEVLDETRQELLNTSSEIRNISHDLMSASLKNYGLFEAVRKLAARMQSGGIQITVAKEGGEAELNGRQISHFFSIIRELVLNSVKHSGASKISIAFRDEMKLREFELKYQDNGKGLENQSGDGIGIGNIRTRVMLMNGNMEMSGHEGFQLSIKIKY